MTQPRYGAQVELDSVVLAPGAGQVDLGIGAALLIAVNVVS